MMVKEVCGGIQDSATLSAWLLNMIILEGIFLLGHTSMVVVRNGALNTNQQQDEILHPVVRLFACVVAPGFKL